MTNLSHTLRQWVRSHDMRFAKDVYKSIAVPLYSLASIPLYDITASDREKYTWFRIPKNGTHSTMQMLNTYAPPEINSSYVPYFRKAHLGHFRFCVLRNPWDRAVSVYSNKVQMKLMYRECWDKDFAFFLDFVSKQNLQKCDAHLRLQTRMFPIADLDFVAHIERFEEDMMYVLKKLGKQGIVPHEGQVPHKDYRTYYTPTLKEKVSSLYDADVKYGKYEF